MDYNLDTKELWSYALSNDMKCTAVHADSALQSIHIGVRFPEEKLVKLLLL